MLKRRITIPFTRMDVNEGDKLNMRVYVCVVKWQWVVLFVRNKTRHWNETNKMNERECANEHVSSPPDDRLRKKHPTSGSTQICSVLRVGIENLNSFLVFISCFPVRFSNFFFRSFKFKTFDYIFDWMSHRFQSCVVFEVMTKY